MGNRQSLHKFSTRNNRSSTDPKIIRRRLDPHSQLTVFRRPIQHQLEAVAPSALLIGIPSHSAINSARPWNRNERLVKTSNISISSLLLFTTLIYVRSIFSAFSSSRAHPPEHRKEAPATFWKSEHKLMWKYFRLVEIDNLCFAVTNSGRKAQADAICCFYKRRRVRAKISAKTFPAALAERALKRV